MTKKRIIKLINRLPLVVIVAFIVIIIISELLPVIFGFDSPLPAKNNIHIKSIRPTCLSISHQEKDKNAFLLENNCIGLISILEELPALASSSPSSSEVGKIISAENLISIDDNLHILEVSLSSRASVLDHEYAWFLNDFTFRRPWQIKGRIGDQDLLITGYTQLNSLGLVLCVLRILFLLSLTYLIIYQALRMIKCKIYQ